MATTPVKDTDPTIGGLVIDASRDISTLISKEIAAGQVRAQGQRQARRHRHRPVRRGRRSSAVLAIIMLSVAIAYFIHMTGLDLAWCFLIVFGVYLLIAALLGYIGVRQVKQVKAPGAGDQPGPARSRRALKGQRLTAQPQLVQAPVPTASLGA